MHKIINITVLQNYKVKLEYADGEKGIADLSHLVGKGVHQNELFNNWERAQDQEPLGKIEPLK